MATIRNKTFKLNTAATTYPVTEPISIENAESITLKNTGENSVQYKLSSTGDIGSIKKNKAVVFCSYNGLISETITFTFVGPGELDVSWVEGAESDPTESLQQLITLTEENQALIEESLAQLTKLATPVNFFNEIAEGNISGISPFSKFGQYLSLNTNAQVIASFGGTFVPMLAASTLSITSSSNNDKAGAGTGAKSVLITGIDSNRAEQSESINLDGTTPVVTTLEYLGVNKVEVQTAGTSETNEGDILIKNVSGVSTNQAELPEGTSTTKQLVFHVPVGKTAKIYSYNFNTVKSSSGSTRITIKGFKFKDGVKVEFFDGQIATNGNPILEEKLDVLLTIEGGSVWWFEAFTDTSNGRISGRVQQILTTN